MFLSKFLYKSIKLQKFFYHISDDKLKIIKKIVLSGNKVNYNILINYIYEYDYDNKYNKLFNLNKLNILDEEFQKYLVLGNPYIIQNFTNEIILSKNIQKLVVYHSPTTIRLLLENGNILSEEVLSCAIFNDRWYEYNCDDVFFQDKSLFYYVINRLLEKNIHIPDKLNIEIFNKIDKKYLIYKNYKLTNKIFLNYYFK